MPNLPCRFTISSKLPLAADRVWARVSTMEGVNAELAPWIRMSVPPAVRGQSLMQAKVGETIFASWIVVAGFLPIDRHFFRLEAIEEGHFWERSHSWLQRVWCHERQVVSTDAGCEVIDNLRFQPRLPFLHRLVLFIVRQVFAHRHRRLARWAESVDAD